MKNFKNIVLDSIPPENRNDLWLHQIDADEGKYELKIFATVKQGNRHSQKWVTIGTGTGNNTTPDTPPVSIEPWYYYKSNEPTNASQFPDYTQVTNWSKKLFLDTKNLFILISSEYNVKVVSENNEEQEYSSIVPTRYEEKDCLLFTIHTAEPLEANITITISKK